MIAILRLNNVDVRYQLAKEGFVLCKCGEYDEAQWLYFESDTYFEIHGIGSNDKEQTHKVMDMNSFLKMCDVKREHGIEVIDFRDDINAFIKHCNQWKKAHKTQDK